MSYQRRITAGTVNTGDAVQDDVASGKVFSSAALTNATGTSAKNATVTSENNLAQPPQAVVDISLLLTLGIVSGTFSFGSKGITNIRLGTDASVYPLLAGLSAASVYNGTFVLDLTGNAITDTDSFLAELLFYVSNTSFGSKPTVSLEGGSNLPPSNDTPGTTTITVADGFQFTSFGTGDYITIIGNGGTTLVWFNNDGTDTAPTDTGAVNAIEVSISSGMSLDDIATITAATLSGQGYVATNTGGGVVFVTYGATGYTGSEDASHGGMGVTVGSSVPDKSSTVVALAPFVTLTTN